MDEFIRRLRRLAYAAAWTANAAAVAALVLITAILIYEIGARFAFNRPTGWSDEAAAYLMPAVVFLGAGYTLLHDGHIRIDTLYLRLSSRAKRWTGLFNETVGLAGLIALVWFAVVMVGRVQRSEGIATAGAYTFPEYLPRIVVPAGLAVMALAQFVVWLYAAMAVLRPERFPDTAEGALTRADDPASMG